MEFHTEHLGKPFVPTWIYGDVDLYNEEVVLILFREPNVPCWDSGLIQLAFDATKLFPLQAIQECGENIPTPEQLKDFMSLCKDLFETERTFYGLNCLIEFFVIQVHVSVKKPPESENIRKFVDILYQFEMGHPDEL